MSNSKQNQMPKLDLDQITPEDKDGGKGSSGRFTSQRPVKQAITTACRLEPADWNNVPKVVYEAIAKIVQFIDDGELKKKAKYDEINV